MNGGNAIGAGIFGAAVMTALLGAMRVLGGPPLNLEMMLGTWITASPGLGSWSLGLAIHLAAGALFGVVYGNTMEVARRRGSGPGLAISVPHWIVAGLILPAVAALHPLVREGGMADPAAGIGPLAVLLFAAAHLLFGWGVGGSYKLRRLPAQAKPAEVPRRPPTAVYGGSGQTPQGAAARRASLRASPLAGNSSGPGTAPGLNAEARCNSDRPPRVNKGEDETLHSCRRAGGAGRGARHIRRLGPIAAYGGRNLQDPLRLLPRTRRGRNAGPS